MQLILDSVTRLRRILHEDREWKWIALLFLATVVALLEAVGAFLIYRLLSVASGGEADSAVPLDLPSSMLGGGEGSDPQLLAVLVGVFFLVRAALVLFKHYCRARLIENSAAKISVELLRGYLAIPYEEFVRSNSSEYIRNAFDSVQQLVYRVMTPLVIVLTEIVVAGGLAAVIFFMAPKATIMVAVILGAAVWILLRFLQPQLRILGKKAQEEREESLRGIQQALGGLRDIRILSREEYFLSRYREARFGLARREYLRTALAALPFSLIEVVLVFAIVTVFFVAGIGEAASSTIPLLGAFGYVGLRLQPSIQKIVQGLNDVRYGSAILDDLIADTRRAEKYLEREEDPPHTAPLQESQFSESIRFHEVSFSYTPGGAATVSDLTFEIVAGEHLGICGPTGGGKSTIVDLLVGLLSPTSGYVYIDGHNLARKLPWWWQQIGLVSQSIYLVDDTLRRNISLGVPDHDVDTARIDEVVQLAQLDSVVDTLPYGLDSVVGERGVRLSGGQRQRVAIARALYRDPRVLVFDEGTSALDPVTERELVTSLNRAKKSRTLITVAHRISTVRDADRIMLVDQGRIVQTAPFSSLVDSSPLFRQLAR